MSSQSPNLLLLIRAPFFSSILAPLFAGTLLAVLASGSFDAVAFFAALVMGVALHAATNVYNDIYDTLQGTDRVNLHRNEFSGGSGYLVDHPELLPKLYRIAHAALFLAAAAGLFLSYWLGRPLAYGVAGLYLLSAFFAKYYTAEPVKLAYRGFGEIAVWFAFGPMAVLLAALTQKVIIHPYVLAALPITGLSTLSILWVGEMMDLQADSATGKRGIVPRVGTAAGRYGYLLIQLLLVANVLWLSLAVLPSGWPLLFSLIPYLLILPGCWRIVHVAHDQPEQLRQAAGMNVRIHLLFSILFILSLTGMVLWPR